MPSTVTLQVQHSDGSSRAFELTEHDTFLLGRMADCHLCLPDDAQVSRHHFLLEACPPQASLRDLGSMNGTHMKPGIMLSRAQADTRAVDQFKREMAVIAKLQHPHIVCFLDSGSDEGTFLFDGQIRQTHLRRLELRRYPLPPPHRKIPLPLRSQARPHRHHPQRKPRPHKSLVCNPKDRFPDAGKLLAALSNPRP